MVVSRACAAPTAPIAHLRNHENVGENDGGVQLREPPQWLQRHLAGQFRGAADLRVPPASGRPRGPHAGAMRGKRGKSRARVPPTATDPEEIGHDAQLAVFGKVAAARPAPRAAAVTRAATAGTGDQRSYAPPCLPHDPDRSPLCDLSARSAKQEIIP